MKIAESLVRCHQANSGEEALDMCKSRFYRLIYVDEHMGGLDGTDFAKKVRELDGYSNSTIISLTADDSSLFREKAIKSGVNGILSKPFVKHALLNSIRTNLPV